MCDKTDIFQSGDLKVKMESDDPCSQLEMHAACPYSTLKQKQVCIEMFEIKF